MTEIDIVFVTALSMLLFGLIYALYIAIRPSNARYTWVSVVVGDAVTNAGISVAIHVLSDDNALAWRLVAVLWTFYFLTGGPMISHQLHKHFVRKNIEVTRPNDEAGLPSLREPDRSQDR